MRLLVSGAIGTDEGLVAHGCYSIGLQALSSSLKVAST
jgi:hypothetical protein